MKKINELLLQLNEEFSKEDIPHHQRPMRAMSEVSKRLKMSFLFDSKEADFIQSWFLERSKPESMLIKPIFQAAFYFDSEFWPVNIPVIFGNVRVDAFDALGEMPAEIIQRIKKDTQNICDYSLFWADCFDLSYGFSDLEGDVKLNPKGIQFLRAGLEELNSATALLLEPRLNKRAILNSRMATEMLLKSYIAIKKGLSEKEARSIGHNIKKALTEFSELSNVEISKEQFELLNLFPSISERYEAQTMPAKDVAKCYNLSLFIAAGICRELSGRNMREQVSGSNL